MRRVIILLFVVQVFAIGAMASGSQLQFTSDPGSWIGQGESHSVAPADGYIFTATVLDPSGVRIWVESTLSIFDPEYHYWDLEIGAPAGDPFVAGTYTDAERYAFATPGQPRLDFTGDYRGANTLTGHFTVHEISFNLGGELERFVAEFTEYEDGDPTKGIYGYIVYDINANGPEDLPAMSLTGLAILVSLLTLLGFIRMRRHILRRTH